MMRSTPRRVNRRGGRAIGVGKVGIIRDRPVAAGAAMA
jgi:hypothetical protein